MKKWLWLILAALGNILVTVGLGYASLALVLIVYTGGVFLGILFVLAQAAGLFFVERQFLKRQWTGRVKFWCITAAPSVVLSVGAFVTVCILDSMGYFTGFFPGLGEFVLALAFLLYSAAVLVVTGIMQFFIRKTLKMS